jgi:hypothetical protein
VKESSSSGFFARRALITGIKNGTMFVELLKSLGLITAALLSLLFWAGSFIYVYFDVSRRKLPEGRQLAWLTLVALAPFLGFFIYRLVRRMSDLPWLARWRQARLLKAAAPPQSITQPMPRQVQPAAHPPFKKGATVPVLVGAAHQTVRGETQPVLVFTPERDLDATPPSRLRTAGRTAPRAPEMLSCQLNLLHNGGGFFRLQTFPAYIGRGPQASVALDSDLEVSRQHAEIYESQGSLRIRDLDSRHGTYLNGLRIGDARLYPGDQIQVGTSLLELEV